MGVSRLSLDRFVVVDVETTGLFDSDRVVEVAAVTLDVRGEVVDEWETLVNPGRHVGATAIHGLTASMVSMAPSFEEVAAALAVRLQGAALVAHNLAFDSRMLCNEYSRLGAAFHAGCGVCTLRLVGRRLADACSDLGIQPPQYHRALADARAAAQLFSALRPRIERLEPARVDGLRVAASARTLRREHVQGGAGDLPPLARTVPRLHHWGETGAILAYLDMLDWALADLRLDPDERSALQTLAGELGLTEQEVARAHDRYLQEMIAAAARDCRVTDEELRILTCVAETLGIDVGTVSARVAPWRRPPSTVHLQPGLRVCFTGSALAADGTEIPRSLLCELAERMGLVPVPSVTKKGCDLLVAGDAATQSSKAAAARRLGLPIVEVRHFLCAESGQEVPVAG